MHSVFLLFVLSTVCSGAYILSPSIVPKSCSYVIISNLQSGANIGQICRNALAFNVHEVLVVGRNNFNGKMRGADRGAKFMQRFVHLTSTAEARDYIKEREPDCQILGVEIADKAISIRDYKFRGSTAFMFGNEGGGLSDRQREICDDLVYIPQFSATGGMASINVACASAITLYSFAISQNYEESTRLGEKFL